MKNVSINVAPYNSYMPPAPPSPPFANLPPAPPAQQPKYQITFTAQFDTEEEALAFGLYLLSTKDVTREEFKEEA